MTDDLNVLWFDWKTKFLTIAEKHAPMRQRGVESDYRPWLTDQIKKLCYQRDFLKKQAVKFKSAAYDGAYLKLEAIFSSPLTDLFQIFNFEISVVFDFS